MKLIVGLGNPGEKYQNTRHNIGYLVVARLARELGGVTAAWQTSEKHRAETARVGDVLLVKPTTFMNNAGLAVKSLVDFYKLDPSDLWVIHDDIDLPLGKIRIRAGGASAGHRGIESIIAHLRSDKFVRFRLGIGRGKESTGRQMDKNLHRRWVIDFVLSRFSQSEAGAFKHLVKGGAKAVVIALTSGLDKAMNRFN
ncbi:MAG: aminoacyl-tRNA hydrolase [Patescibacteria group bacterium]